MSWYMVNWEVSWFLLSQVTKTLKSLNWDTRWIILSPLLVGFLFGSQQYLNEPIGRQLYLEFEEAICQRSSEGSVQGSL